MIRKKLRSSIECMKKDRPPPLNVIGAEVRAARLRKQLSQAQLAEMVHAHGWNAPRTVIAKIEMGVRCVSDYELVTLCRVLEVSADYLIRDAPHKMRAIFANSGK